MMVDGLDYVFSPLVSFLCCFAGVFALLFSLRVFLSVVFPFLVLFFVSVVCALVFFL